MGYGKSQISQIQVNTASFALTASYALSGGSGGSGSVFPYTGSALISGGLVVTGSTISTNGFTGSLFGTASWATNVLTASYVNTLNQNVIISGSLTVGSTSLGASENTLTLGARDSGGEGGQLGLQAPGGTYTSASMLDNYQNQTRLLRGSNAGSDAVVAQWNMHSKQMQLPAYNSPTAFTATPVVGLLAFDSNGNIITTTTGSGGGGSGVTITNNTDNYIITATGIANTINGEANLQFDGSKLTVTGEITASGAIRSLANGAMYFRGGDDAEFWDINVANTVGIYGQQNADRAGLKLGSSGPTLFGSASRFGIGTITPTQATLEVNGNVFASSFTGSLFGTSSWATNAITASSAIITSTGADNNYSVLFVTSSISPSPLNYNNGRLFFNPSSGILTATTYANTNAGTVNPITSSWASTASIALSASFATSASFVTSAFFATSASFATNALTASVVATIEELSKNTNHPIIFVTSSVNSSGSILNFNSSRLYFNPNTSILTAGTFANTSVGTINPITSSWAVSSSQATSASFATSSSFSVSSSFATTALSSSFISTVGIDSNSIFYPTFVDSNNATANFEQLYTDNKTALTYNPSSGDITSKTFTSNTSGIGFIGTSSWATNALTASFLPAGTYNITSSQAQTASFTPNALITASVSSNVLTFTKGNGTTFNLTVNTGSGGGGTPGGADTNIQFNSGSAFGGSSKFTYEYDNASQFSNRLYHQYSEDFRTNPFTTDFKGSYLQENRASNDKQLAGVSHFQYNLPATTGATTIYSFDTNGGSPGNLSMHGFKCDYSLLLFDGINKIASRVGTLIGAWSYDTAITPVIQDTFVDGDQVFNELGTVMFTLIWNGSNIELQMDCTNVNNGATYFNGLFTNFGST